MPKRSRIISVSPESIAMKHFRNKMNISQRKLAVCMGISQTKVNHLESGRENFKHEFINSLILYLDISRQDWDKKVRESSNSLLTDSNKTNPVFDNCIIELKKLTNEQLDIIHGLLVNINK